MENPITPEEKAKIAYEKFTGNFYGFWPSLSNNKWERAPKWEDLHEGFKLAWQLISEQ